MWKNPEKSRFLPIKPVDNSVESVEIRVESVESHVESPVHIQKAECIWLEEMCAGR